MQEIIRELLAVPDTKVWHKCPLPINFNKKLEAIDAKRRPEYHKLTDMLMLFAALIVQSRKMHLEIVESNRHVLRIVETTESPWFITNTKDLYLNVEIQFKNVKDLPQARFPRKAREKTVFDAIHNDLDAHAVLVHIKPRDKQIILWDCNGNGEYYSNALRDFFNGWALNHGYYFSDASSEEGLQDSTKDGWCEHWTILMMWLLSETKLTIPQIESAIRDSGCIDDIMVGWTRFMWQCIEACGILKRYLAKRRRLSK